MADTYLTKTFASAGNRKTFTFSVWLKQSFSGGQSGNRVIFSAGSASNTYCQIRMKSPNNYIQFEDEQGGSVTATPYTDAFFRDPNAWNHLVVRVDSTQSTASDRVRMYMNGTQLTMSGGTQPSQNQDFIINNDVGHALGTLWRGSDSGGHWHGYMAQAIFCDGQSLAPTSFGSTNSDGVWIPNPGPSVTYGTNGFKIDFKGTGASADSSGFGADTSGNNNHFATTNIGTNPSTKDSPTNNFAVINAAANYYAGAILAEGATKITTDGANYTYNVSSIGVSAGKWYIEAKIGAGINNWFGAGIAEGESSNASGVLGRDTYYPAGNEFGQIGWYGNGTDFVYQNDGYYSGSTSDYDTDGYTTGDIISIALDADNNNVKFYKNGTVQNSGNAFTLGASSTGFWHFAFGDYDGQNAGSHTFQVNFGNPAFTIASSNADANGYGSFEYAVPSGYYALCTKNLATYG